MLNPRCACICVSLRHNIVVVTSALYISFQIPIKCHFCQKITYFIVRTYSITALVYFANYSIVKDPVQLLGLYVLILPYSKTWNNHHVPLFVILTIFLSFSWFSDKLWQMSPTFYVGTRKINVNFASLSQLPIIFQSESEYAWSF